MLLRTMIHDLTLASMAAAWLLAACAAFRIRSRRAFLGLGAVTAAGLLVFSPIGWVHYFLMLVAALLYLQPRPSLLLGVAVIGLIAGVTHTLRDVGGQVLVAMGLSAMIVRDLWMTQPPPRSVLLTEARRLSPVVKLGVWLVVVTAVLLVVAFLPGVDTDTWSDLLLEPMSVVNLAFGAVLSLRLSWMRLNGLPWRVLAVALTLAAADDLIGLHDLVHSGVTYAMGAMAGRDVWIGDDDVIVVGYTLAFAAVFGWAFRRDLLQRRWPSMLFGLAGALTVVMAICDSSTGWYHWLEAPCEVAATAMVLAGLIAEVLLDAVDGPPKVRPLLT